MGQVFVTKADFRTELLAGIRCDAPVLAPARSAAADVAAYVARAVPPIPADVVEAPGFDITSYTEDYLKHTP